MGGFGPSTPCSQDKCSTKLSYTQIGRGVNSPQSSYLSPGKDLVADVGVEPTCLGYEPSLGPIQVIRDKLGELHPRKFIKWNGLVPPTGHKNALKRVNGRAYLYTAIRFQIANRAFCKIS